MRGNWKFAAAGAAAIVLLLILGGLVFIYSGVYDIAASTAHFPPVAWAVETTMEHSVSSRAKDVGDAPRLEDDEIRHAFRHFQEMCEVCHGAPGVDRGEIGRGLTPEPPALSEHATEWTDRELFWIAKHGIKMTGMPAFGATHDDRELWALVEVVKQLPELTPEEYRSRSAADHAGHR